jgi:hypothetical protein
MDCSNCAWGTDREACRACRQEQSLKAQSVTRQPWDIGHDVPGFQERTESAIMADASADGHFQGFLALKGEEHVHYIRHAVDEVEYVDHQYGHQN